MMENRSNKAHEVGRGVRKLVGEEKGEREMQRRGEEKEEDEQRNKITNFS